MDAFYGIDIGTTYCKIAVCDENRRIKALKSFTTPLKTDNKGACVYNAEELWSAVKKIIAELSVLYRPLSIGVASMAEAGILIDCMKGTPVSDIIPWHDKRSVSYFNSVHTPELDREGFFRTGLHNAYKYSVYKLLKLKNDFDGNFENTTWLSAAAYIVYCLTGCFGEDYTLALRTYCFSLSNRSYDTDFIKRMGLPETIFAPAFEAGKPTGFLKDELINPFGLKAAIPVSVCGHDHLCASVASGALSEKDILLSLGTTAIVLGNFDERLLVEDDFKSGYSFGLHPISGRMTWMGTIQSAGSAIDWSRTVISFDDKDFQDMFRWLEEKREDVTGILFFPYLSGSGAPMLDISVRGSWIGLSRDTDRGTLIKSVLEGISYEVRMILEKAKVDWDEISIRAAGGNSQNPYFMQILADVTGRPVIASDCGQEAATGAALIASGIFLPVQGIIEKIYLPDRNRNRLYTEIYENGYQKLQQPLRNYFKEEFKRVQNR